METNYLKQGYINLFELLINKSPFDTQEYAAVFAHRAFLLQDNPYWLNLAQHKHKLPIQDTLNSLSPIELLGLLDLEIISGKKENLFTSDSHANQLLSFVLHKLQRYSSGESDTYLEVYRWMIEYSYSVSGAKGIEQQNIHNMQQHFSESLIETFTDYTKFVVDDLTVLASLLEYGDFWASTTNNPKIQNLAQQMLSSFQPEGLEDEIVLVWLKTLVTGDSKRFYDVITSYIQQLLVTLDSSQPIKLTPKQLIRLLRMFQTIQRLSMKEKALWFVNQETQFHLGHIPTEQSHHVTRNLSSITEINTAQGVKQLLQVDRDLLVPARQVVTSKDFEYLVQSITQVVKNKKRIRFSGCGSTGRLSAILEIMWRNVWKAQGSVYQDAVDLAAGIITGGDRALVKSVENFEDYEAFGRRQMADLGIGVGDLCIAISEGGETSSVIGTAWEALDRGANVFFLFNNPKDVLVSSIERSRRLIQDPRVISIDLTTGPMAITGSTRMQATSMELLILGIALELAVEQVTKGLEYSESLSLDLVRKFTYILDQLNTESNIETLGRLVDVETQTYKRQGLVTYLADHYLMDVFSDTSERTPTFNLPPMRSLNEHHEQPSWAFPKHSSLPTHKAWSSMLSHEPRGLEWTKEDYNTMDAEQTIQDNPPPLATKYLYDYPIGIDHLDDRLESPGSILIGVSIGQADGLSVKTSLDLHNKKASAVYHLHIGDQWVIEDTDIQTLLLQISIPTTQIKLFEHLTLKLILNAFSSATMAKLGRVQGNYMIFVNPTNKKLIDRGCRIISSLGNMSYSQACYELFKTSLLPQWLLKDASKVAKTLHRVKALR